MAEVAAARGRNGLSVVSTFSGCGGSCLGFEMAGYDVRYAVEFVPEARATYRANHPGVFVDERDVRLIQPDEILERIGIGVGELDVLEGSPPCKSFSTAGKREKGWGQSGAYSDGIEQRSDDLFFEYVRLLRGLRPRAFVAENVSGLVKGTAKGYFKWILAEMKRSGYAVEARTLDAQWLGVPQARQRVIFVGVRNDVGRPPVYPRPLPYRYSIRDAIGDLVDGNISAQTVRDGRRLSLDMPATTTIMTHGRLHTQSERGIEIDRRSAPPDGDGPSLDGYAVGDEWIGLRPGESSERYFSLVRPHPDRPSPTVTALGGSNPGVAGVTHPSEKRKFTIAELKRVCAFPDDFALTGTYAQQWERLGRAVPPVMMFHVARAVARGVFDKE